MLIKKAVIDRIVEDKAVILVGDEELENIIPVNQLPKGSKEGDWLVITFTGSEITDITIDEQNTINTKKRIQNKMELLRQRSKRK